MDLKHLYIKALEVPAIEFKITDRSSKIVFKQGNILTSAYISIIKKMPSDQILSIQRHSQNLFSICVNSKDSRYVFGPVMLTDATPNTQMKEQEKTIYLPQLLNSYSLPREQCINQLLVFTNMLDLSFTYDDLETAFQQTTPSDEFSDKLVLVNFKDEGAHVSYAYEKALKTAVEIGKPSMIHDAFVGLVNSGRIGILSDESDLRNIKDWGIICTSVTLRAAIDSGMDYDQAYSLNDHYVRNLETLKTYDEVMNTIEKMLRDMAQRVSQLKSVHLSAPVRRAYEILMNEPETRITVQQLSNQLGISSHYLSNMFKNEVGVPLSKFKMLVKINRSLEILQTTNLPLSEISAIMNFSDQAHLTREFEKYVGVSPSQARIHPHTTDDWHLYNFLKINIG